jgi:hypothetical protein
VWAVATLNTNSESPDFAVLSAGLGAAVLGVLMLTTRMSPWVVLGYVATAGVALRLHQPVIIDSDVWKSIVEGNAILFGGHDPYALCCQTTVPPGSPLPYLPGALLYGLLQNGWWNGLAALDRPAGIVVVLAIAALARVYGPGWVALAGSIYSISVLAIWRAVDGSNDTALAALLAIGVVALVYALATPAANPRRQLVLYVISAVFFGWAIGFKALAWPVYPFVARAIPPERRRLWLGLSLGVFAALCVPFFVWNPTAFVRQIVLGFTFHTNVYGLSIWNVLDHDMPGATAGLGIVPTLVALLAVLGAAYLLWRRKPATVGEALAQSGALLAIIVAVPRWSSSAYYTYAFAIVALAVATFPPLDLRGGEPLPSDHVKK